MNTDQNGGFSSLLEHGELLQIDGEDIGGRSRPEPMGDELVGGLSRMSKVPEHVLRSICADGADNFIAQGNPAKRPGGAAGFQSIDKP
jgi:hypothetical protein